MHKGSGTGTRASTPGKSNGKPVAKALRLGWQREGELQSYVLSRLRAMPEMAVVKVIQATENGVSDILLCAKGRFVALELKSEKGKPTALQLLFIHKVIQAGGHANVCKCWPDVARVWADVGYAEYDSML